MKIKEIEIINLTQTEIKTIIIFLLKNKHFKKEIFLYSRWEYLVSLLLISGVIYLICLKINFILMIERKDTKQRTTYGKKGY
jgi:hypothetical protein